MSVCVWGGVGLMAQKPVRMAWPGGDPVWFLSSSLGGACDSSERLLVTLFYFFKDLSANPL